MGGYDRPVLQIAKIRKSKKMRQHQLADACGMSQPNISDIERGKHNPSLETLHRIANALEVSVSDLFAEDEQGRTDLEDELIRLFRRLSPDRQQGWLDMARVALAQDSEDKDPSPKGRIEGS